jgi:hypothetical protein
MMGGMDDDEGAFEAARAIRPYLADLAGSAEAAATLDRLLAEELRDTSDRPAGARRLRVLLRRNEDTAWFLDRVLADAPYYRPPYQQPAYQTRGTRGILGGGFPGVLGNPMPAAATRYNCPVCEDYVWYRPDVGTPVIRCPDDDVLLTRA